MSASAACSAVRLMRSSSLLAVANRTTWPLRAWLYPQLRKLGLYYGDSAIFVRHAVYDEIGGFRPHPIFEDLDLVKRLRKRGRVAHTEKFDELAEYDGSVVVERTKGEIAARCDKEEANFLALNLANEIATGKRSVEDARKFYAEAIRAMKHAEYMKGFLFQVSNAERGDADREVMTKGDENRRSN